MRALVTGATGFVGKHLTAHLTASGDEVIACGSAQDGKSLGLDIADERAVFEALKAHRPEVIYHLAGIAFVPEAEQHFERTLKVNVLGTHHVLRACTLLEYAPTVVVVSSAEVYGCPHALPLTETHETAPLNNYSLSKRMAELSAERYRRSFKGKIVVARPFNHIGPGQNERFVTAAFAKQIALIKRGILPPVMKVGNLTARRDFSDVRDIVRGYRLAALKGDGVYNFCSGHSTEVSEILASLLRLAEVEVRKIEDPALMRPCEVQEIYGSHERAQRELGWTPAIPLTQTLTDVLEFWLSKKS